jgi:hypothetical protein
MPSVELSRARTFWFHRQGLAAPLGGPIDKVIAATGWLRTLGGVDVYLAARARAPGLRRADLDAAVADGRLRVSMAVRGCIYLVPVDEVPTLLAEAAPEWRKKAERDVAKAGASWKVVEATAAAVLEVLVGAELSTDAIRRALPATKGFGEAGKKVGLSSPLPLALRVLELDRKIERMPEGGRLDTERYVWRAPKRPVPPAASDPVARRARIASAFFTHAGPARLADLRAWTCWSQRDTSAAIEGLDLAPVTIAGFGEALVHRRELDLLATPSRGAVALLSFEDNYLTLHGGPGVVTDPAHHHHPVPQWGSDQPGRLGEARHVAHRTVVVDGMVAALWEVDPRTGGGIWKALAPLPRAVADQVAAAVDDTARFLLAELGHARSFALDTMAEVQRRADAIRSGAATGAKAPAKSTTKTTRRAAAAAKQVTKKKPAPAKKRRR